MKPQYICGLALWGTVGIFIAASVLAGKLGSEPLRPSLGANWIDQLKLTNSFVWEAPQPSKVTIWFRIQPGDQSAIGQNVFGCIQTNVWPVTASNALDMLRYRLKNDGLPISLDTVHITGIWRDE